MVVMAGINFLIDAEKKSQEATPGAGDGLSISIILPGFALFLLRDNQSRILVDGTRCKLLHLRPVTYEYSTNCLDDYSYDRWRIDYP
jgi:hypothetical protein